MERNEKINAKKILFEAYKRLVPSAAYLAGSTAGFIASVAVFATWLLASARKKPSLSMEEEDKAIAGLRHDLAVEEARLRLLEKAREKALREGRDTEALDKAIEAEKEIIENMRSELALRELRLEALRRLQALGDKEALRQVTRLIEKIEKGKDFEEEQYRVLRELEDRWRRREIEITALREMLRHV